MFRKQRRWAEAASAFQQALGLCPGQPGTYAALGYTYHLQARHLWLPLCPTCVFGPLPSTTLPCLTCPLSSSVPRLCLDQSGDLCGAGVHLFSAVVPAPTARTRV